MSETNKCPQCGKPVPESAPGGLCPECMLKVGAAAPTEEFGPEGTRVVRPSPKEPASVDEVAKLFPHLEIIECLGRGGMGVVYKARQPKLNRLTALKILAPEKESDPMFAERFTREARALARLSHPNIVAVHDFGETDGVFYLLMEFVDGVNLRKLMQAGRVAPEQALAVVPKICEALQYAHGKGIVHRDIKPENVLLDKDGQVKIADFGIAKLIRPEEGQPSITEDNAVGTPHYMAPEQVEHPKTVDHRADIYSLGVVFYEMLTGELPLGKFAPPSRKVQMDVRLDEVVLHALEKEPDRRYQHASQIKTDVETISAASAKSEVRSSKSEVASAALNPIAVAGRQVGGPGIGLIVTGILNWVCMPLSLWVATRSFSHGGSGGSISPGSVAVVLGLLPLVLGGFMIYAGLMMRRLKHYPAAIIASVGAILFTPANLLGLPIGIWALVVLSGKDVRAAFRAVSEGASPSPTTVQSEKASSGSSGSGWLVAGVVVLVPVVGLIALLLLGLLVGLFRYSAVRTPVAVPAEVVDQRRVYLANPESQIERVVVTETGARIEGYARPNERILFFVGSEENSVGCEFPSAGGFDAALEQTESGLRCKVTRGKREVFLDTHVGDAGPYSLTGDIRFLPGVPPSENGVFTVAELHPESGQSVPIKVKLVTPQTEAATQPGFGPVSEHTMTPPEVSGTNQAAWWLDLDTGERIQVPPDLVEVNPSSLMAEALANRNPKSILAVHENRLVGWMNSNGVELACGIRREQWGLLTPTGSPLELVPVTEEEWGNADLAQVLRELEAGQSNIWHATEGSAFSVLELEAEAAFPLTYAFRTGAGTVGLLRVTGFAQGGTGIQIQFKRTHGITSTHAPVARTNVATDSAPNQAELEKLQLRLDSAQNQLALAEARYRAGEAPQNQLQAAQTEVAVLEAQLEGDTTRVARIRLDAAQRALEFAQARFEAGLVTSSVVEAARLEVQMREIDLKELLATPAAAVSEPMTLTSSVQLMQSDPIRRLWRWQVARQPGTRMLYGVLDVTDPDQPQQLLMGMEKEPLTIKSAQDYTLRLTPERKQWRIEIEAAWAGENGGRGATWDKIDAPDSATLHVPMAEPFGELGTERYHVFWQGELKSDSGKLLNRLQFVGRLAEAEDPIQNILGPDDRVHGLDDTSLSFDAVAREGVQHRATLMRKTIFLLPLLLIGLVVVMLVLGGAGWWIYAGNKTGTSLGRAALVLAIGGLPFTAILTVILGNLGINMAEMVPALFLALEIPAFCLGLLSRQTSLGKAAMIVSATLLLVSLVFVI